MKPSGQEIQRYLMTVCEQYRIVDNIQLRTEITHLKWLDNEQVWEAKGLRLPSMNTPLIGDCEPFNIRAKVVISAMGKLTKPRSPELEHLPGFDQFEGDIIHAAQWDDRISLKGKDLVVVGTGCTAAQLTPQLIKPSINAKSVTQLMRSAPWVAPNIASRSQPTLWDMCMPWLLRNIPGFTWVIRGVIFAICEMEFFTVFRPTMAALNLRARRKNSFLKYMRRSVPPKYQQILSPQYEIGCKRVIHDAGWFDSLKDPRHQLLMANLVRLEKRAVILAAPDTTKETRTPADAIILATGYDTVSLLPSVSIMGRDGTDLHKLWEERGGVHAYMGLAVSKFPNFFLLYGPNTSNGHTSIIIGIENALNYILRLMRPIVEGHVSSWEVKAEACERWTTKIQEASQDSVWVNGGCQNWYVNGNKWNGLIYPYVFPTIHSSVHLTRDICRFSQLYGTYCLMFPVWDDWIAIHTRDGTWKEGRGNSFLLWLLVGLAISLFLWNVL
jgi:cation diffusion facilitator CzcD-associated flavoprotein CzcO